MSDNIKLIIEIPRIEYEQTCNLTLHNRTFYDEAIRNGTPLDDVKAEIKTFTIAEKSKYDRGFNEAVLKCFNALDNIGNAESIDPNDMTRMFEGVTEIPKDAFKGWYTDELLEQIRKENNDNPEDTGCDHND